MKRALLMTVVLLVLLPGIAKAQWTFDIVSVEAYINDHKKQRSLLLARSTLEYSNKLLHEYSRKEIGEYKELNVDLDRYTRAFDVIDVMYQSLRTVLNVKSTYTAVSDRIGDYKKLLEDFNERIVKRGRIDPGDAVILAINEKAIRDIANDGEQLYKSVSDLVLYATGAAACSTSDLLLVLEAVNTSLDDIERHLNRAYIETWRYIQVRIGYWKAKIYRPKVKAAMKRALLMTVVLLVLLPGIAKAQWTFDIVSVEAYINDHKKQRSLLLARSTLEYSNKLLHEYSRKEIGEYKELNVDLDRYTRAFDVIDVMYQSLRTVLNVKSTYTAVSDRIGDYKKLLEDFNERIVKRGRIDPGDAVILAINEKAIRDIANDGEQLYKSVSDLVLYATGAAACSTSDLLLVLEAVNTSLDDIERHLNRAYIETWRYIQVRIGYWKAKIYRPKVKEIIDGAFGRWRKAGRLDY